jgi:hypothetical protein
MTSGNITLRLDETLIKRIRRIAVDAVTSVSGWVTGLVTRALEEADGYERARRQALASLAEPVPLYGTPLLRDAAHER